MTILTNLFVSHPFGQIEQGAHYALYKKIIVLIDEERAFQEKAVVELVYKFDEDSYHECLKW